MSILKKIAIIGLGSAFILSLSACTAEVGSDKWCSNMKAKDKSEWTASEAGDYAKHCILK